MAGREPITINGQKYSYDEGKGKWFSGGKEAPNAVAAMLERVSKSVARTAPEPVTDKSDVEPSEQSTPNTDADIISKPSITPSTKSPETKPSSSKSRPRSDLDNISDKLSEKWDKTLDKEEKVYDRLLQKIETLGEILKNIRGSFVKRDATDAKEIIRETFGKPRQIEERESLNRLSDLTESEIRRLKRLGIAPSSPQDFSYRRDGVPVSKENIVTALNQQAQVHNKQLEADSKTPKKPSRLGMLKEDFVETFKEQIRERAHWTKYVPGLGDLLEAKQPPKRDGVQASSMGDVPEILLSINDNVSKILSTLRGEDTKKDEEAKKRQVDDLEAREEKAFDKDKRATGKSDKKPEDEHSTIRDRIGQFFSFGKKKKESGIGELLKTFLEVEGAEKIGGPILKKGWQGIKSRFGRGKAAGASEMAGEAAGAVEGAEGAAGLAEGAGMAAEAVGGAGLLGTVGAGLGAVAGIGGLVYGAKKLADYIAPVPDYSALKERYRKTHPDHSATPVKPSIQPVAKEMVAMTDQKAKKQDEKQAKRMATAGHTVINNQTRHPMSSGGGSAPTVSFDNTAAPRNSLDLGYWSN